MQACGGNADFAAQAELAAVGKARGGIDHHHRRAQRVDEALGIAAVFGGNHFGVVGGIAADVGNGRIQIVDHAYRQHQVEELGGVILVGGGAAAWQLRLGTLVRTQLHTALAQRPCHAWQECIGHVAVHQQRLQ
ncbi:hypothetical protein G6F50_016443 [Rhizopus delemar]|uniref:Uncharacterized protein n=1 Tax=Rhizopus delemar TaxID=936053 RepID=A0A9P6XT09_9FUNG|nr:hypothetical protein G6F50_016443 [Rhizopus delemar]